MEGNLKGLKLTEKQLSDIREALTRKIINGLRTQDREIKMLPAYIRRPPRNLSGDAVVLDIGGTNIRAARIRIQDQRIMLLNGPFIDTKTMQMGKLGQIEAREFFAKQADLIEKVCLEKEINLGYCFSYPTEIVADGNARLLKWTKGVNIPNTVGTLLGSKIRAALNEKGKKIMKLAILNDTVASLLAGAWMEPDCTHNIGLIVSTGTNMAGFFPVPPWLNSHPKILVQGGLKTMIWLLIWNREILHLHISQNTTTVWIVPSPATILDRNDSKRR